MFLLLEAFYIYIDTFTRTSGIQEKRGNPKKQDNG